MDGRLLFLPGRHGLVRADALKGVRREETLPARCAAICRNAHQPKKPGKPASYMLPRDSLEVQIAAFGAMDMKQERNSNRRGVKAKLTCLAPPGTKPKEADSIVFEAMALGAATAPAAAVGAKHSFLLTKAA